jgi:RecJ-like exonuclease
MTQHLIKAMTAAIDAVQKWPAKKVHIFHHNDADGLSSGAILTRAFERQGFDIERLCLEKPYPRLLEKVFERKGALYVFTDLAGRIAPLISDLNMGRNLILILDHHVAHPATDPQVHNLDPDLFGFKGDRDISASTTCYLFARTMDPANVDLAHIAAIGAVGDGFYVDGRLASENRKVAMEAARQGKLEIKKTDSGEQYFLTSSHQSILLEALARDLDILGAAGYLDKGPEVGVQVCLEGRTAMADQMLVRFKKIQQKAFAGEILRLEQGGLQQTSHIQWFHVQDRFAPMGCKMIGAFCEAQKNAAFFDPDKYIAGFQFIPDEIPRYGYLPLQAVNISMRAPAPVEEKIKQGTARALNTFLPEATDRLGGFSDACHRLAAATMIAAGREEDLIREMNAILRVHQKASE